MKTPLLVGIVVGVHCIAVGSVVLIQGCGTTVTGPVGPPPDPPMPPSVRPALGPTRVPAAPAVSTRPPAKSWPSQTSVYSVRKGDLLSSIAQRYGLTVAELTALNRLKNPDVLRIGQKLMLPGKVDITRPRPTPPSSRPRPVSAAAPVSPADGGSYVVRAGDSLSVIASRYGTTVAALKTTNRLSSDRILVGQRIVIPGSSPVRATTRPNPVPSSPAPANSRPGIMDLDLGDKPVPPRPPAPPPAPTAAIGRPPSGSPGFPPSPPSLPPSSSTRKHVVVGDEDLYSVAMMWDVTVEEIKTLNNLADTTLTQGQELKIPMSE